MLHGSLATALWANRDFVTAAIAVRLAVGLSRINEWESPAIRSHCLSLEPLGGEIAPIYGRETQLRLPF